MDEYLLKKYIKHGSAFGPTDASLIKTDMDVALKELFDPQNKIYNALRLNPSMIIGRRGSGKTAYLHSIFLDDEFAIVQEIRTSKTFSQIVAAIETNMSSYTPAEDIADLWQELFYLALMSEVSQKFSGESKELKLIADFVAKNAPMITGTGRSTNTVDSFLWKITRTLSNKSGNNFVGAVATLLQEVAGIEFESAKEKTLAVLESRGIRAILLLDSLEQYPTRIQSVSHALAGLLKCVGQFNARNDRFNVRLCLPAELYHVFLDLVSTNPHKDFSPPNALILHWIAGELISVAAHRLSLYLRLYFPKISQAKLDMSKREDARDCLRSCLPHEITNGLGVKEDPIGYILRHTQLQPRHLLIYLNAIFEKQRRLDDTSYPKIGEESVKAGIAGVEHLLAEEVFSGYQLLYPTARDACEACIPELPLTFGHSILQKVFTRRGKKASGVIDFWEFRRIFLETGIIGRVVGETDRYVVGRFEYTEPHKLVVSTEDKLCLHPVFAEVFHYKKNGTNKTIYPYGSDPDGADHRDWQFAP